MEKLGTGPDLFKDFAAIGENSRLATGVPEQDMAAFPEPSFPDKGDHSSHRFSRIDGIAEERLLLRGEKDGLPGAGVHPAVSRTHGTVLENDIFFLGGIVYSE